MSRSKCIEEVTENHLVPTSGENRWRQLVVDVRARECERVSKRALGQGRTARGDGGHC